MPEIKQGVKKVKKEIKLPVEHSIKETKEVLKFLFVAFKQGKIALEDGAMSMFDVRHFFAVLPLVKPALDDIKLVPAEIKNLDESEIAELMAFCKAEFFPLLGDKELLAKIEIGLEAAHAMYKLVKEII